MITIHLIGFDREDYLELKPKIDEALKQSPTFNSAGSITVFHENLVVGTAYYPRRSVAYLHILGSTQVDIDVVVDALAENNILYDIETSIVCVIKRDEMCDKAKQKMIERSEAVKKESKKKKKAIKKSKGE